MSVEQIISDYNHAANKLVQIDILADLNECDPADICELLDLNGVPAQRRATSYYGRSRRVNPDELIRLKQQGKTISQLSRHFNVTRSVISKHLTRLRERGICIDNN